MIKQPQNLKIKLYDHQLVSIQKMEELENNNIIDKTTYTKETQIGVNSDIIGHGKTLSMIGLIVRDKIEWDIEIPFVFEKINTFAKGRIKERHISRFKKLPATLILVTLNIISQWENELNYSNLKYTTIKNKKHIDELDPYNFDVIIVSPTMYNNLICNFPTYAWKRFIFDEPGNLKIPGMKEIFANFYWFVTSNPNSISKLHRNCKGFMKDIINNSWTDFDIQFQDVIIKNDPEFVKKSFKMPDIIHLYYTCYQPILNVIKNLIDPKVKTMIEAGNIELAISYLGGKKTDNIVELVKNKKREELIEINAKIEIYRLRNSEDNLENYQNKKNIIIDQINNLEKKYNSMLNDTCPICYDTINKPVLEPGCQNIFCGLCFFKSIEIRKKCPLCIRDVDLKDIIYIKKDNEIINEIIVKKNIVTKIDKIIELIKNKINGKFLIYSEHSETFYPISKALSDNNIQYLQIKGNIKTREKHIEMFKNGKISIIFLNSNDDCAGINLQETTDIILYHAMSDPIEKQIIGRAARIGRENELYVHHLVINDEN